MKQAEIGILFDYNYWATRRILNAAAHLNQAQLEAATAFPRRSLRGTLLHILDAEYGWRVLLEERREAPDLTEAEFPSLALLEARWQEEQASMRAYIAGLSNEQLGGVLRYTNPQGKARERVVWQCLFHVVNHGTQHRSEAAAMLTDLGFSPGDVDFSMFALEHQAQGA